MLHDFADSLGRKIEWIDVFRSEEVLRKLVSGEGDLSISAVPIDHRNDIRLSASEPIAIKRFRVVGNDKLSVDNPLALTGTSLAVKLSSPMWPYLRQLRMVVDDLRLQVLPNELSREETLKMISDGTYDAALVTTAIGDNPIAEFPRLKFLFDLSGTEGVSWFTHRDNQRLIDSVNKFITRYHTAYDDPEPSMRTFGDIKHRGVLRVITRLDGNNYFLSRGRPAGFELDLARQFAKTYGLRVEVLVGRSDKEVLGWLRTGAGDVVTSRIHARSVHGEPTFAMSREYRHNASVLVTAASSPIRSTVELRDKVIAGYEGTSDLIALTEFAGGVSSVVAVDDSVPLASLLERIETGVIDAAIVGAHNLEFALNRNSDLVTGMSIPNPYRYRWTLRAADAALAQAVENFMRDEYREETYNILARRYVGGSDRTKVSLDYISPFDDLLQTYAAQYEFDWRLIAAQMYQESQFDPNAVSTAGALGLMQLMPATADSIGVRNPRDPEAGIRGGVKYLDYLRNRFDRRIPVGDRTWLALAAYNIGYDRVRRARLLARELGLNPDKWFDNVEFAMRRMTQMHMSSRGGCRCGQAIVYVRAIQSLYHTYRNLEVAAKATPAPTVLPHTRTRRHLDKAQTG